MSEVQNLLQAYDVPAQLRLSLNQLCSQVNDLVWSNEQLRAENVKLKQALLGGVEAPDKLSDLAKKILSWLSKRQTESATAIAFGVCVETTKAQTVLDELCKQNLVECIDRTSDKWKITEVGKHLAIDQAT